MCMSIRSIEAGGYEVRKEGYLPCTVEPFVFKGGITAEMQVMSIFCTSNMTVFVNVHFCSDFCLPWTALKIYTHSKRLPFHLHLSLLSARIDQKIRYKSVLILKLSM